MSCRRRIRIPVCSGKAFASNETSKMEVSKSKKKIKSVEVQKLSNRKGAI